MTQPLAPRTKVNWKGTGEELTIGSTAGSDARLLSRGTAFAYVSVSINDFRSHGGWLSGLGPLLECWSPILGGHWGFLLQETRRRPFHVSAAEVRSDGV